jgi:hypothetical protein
MQATDISGGVTIGAPGNREYEGHSFRASFVCKRRTSAAA